jgi:DMSO reductase anchor subunit
MTRTVKALGLRLLGFAQKNPALVFSLLVVGVGVLFQGAFANTVAESVTNTIQQQIQGIVCPLAKLLVGPIARIISLIIFIGAIIYYLTNDSRTAKGLAVAAIIALILANTFPTWQQLFTGQAIGDLCPTWTGQQQNRP